MTMTLDAKRMDPPLGRIAAGAVVLRERAASTRARLLARQETLIRLRAELTELRSIVDIEAPRAPKTRRPALRTSLPVLCLIGTFLVVSRFHVAVSAARPKMESSAVPLPARGAGGDKSAEALALVRQWRMAGNDRSLFERLGGVIEHPGGAPAWSAETSGGGAYLVIFREAAGAPIYAFEADLASKTVLPTPEAAALLNVPPRSN